MSANLRKGPVGVCQGRSRWCLPRKGPVGVCQGRVPLVSAKEGPVGVCQGRSHWRLPRKVPLASAKEGVPLYLMSWPITANYFLCRIVRLTSPNLNYFILGGAVFLYVSIYFRLYPDSSEVYQHARCNVSRAVIRLLTLVDVCPVSTHAVAEHLRLHRLLPRLCSCAGQNVAGLLHFPQSFTGQEGTLNCSSSALLKNGYSYSSTTMCQYGTIP